MELFIVLGGLFNLANPLYSEYFGFNKVDPWVVWLIAAAVYLIIVVFKAIGLYTMAKKQNKNKLVWCAFVPFASTYLMGELAGTLRLGNVKIKHIGVYAMIAEIVLSLCYALQYVPQSFIFMDESMYVIEAVEGASGATLEMYYTNNVPLVIVNMMKVAAVFGNIFYFVQLVVSVFLFMGFFKVYSPLSYVWMVVLCVLVPLATAFLVFAFRNRTPIDYEKFMQARMEQIRRAQQAQYGPYGPYGQNPYGQNPYGQNPYGGPYGQNPYGQNPYGQNPYGQNPYNGRPNGGQPADPFGEYSSAPQEGENASNGDRSGQNGNGAQSGGDPFGEFSGQNKQGGNNNSDGGNKSDS